MLAFLFPDYQMRSAHAANTIGWRLTPPSHIVPEKGNEEVKLASVAFLWGGHGCNGRKVISEVYASFVLPLSGNVNTRRMSKSDMGSIFHLKKSMKYSCHRKLLCELSKFNAFDH